MPIAGLDADVAARYDRVMVCATPVLVISIYACYAFLRTRWRPPLKSEAVIVWSGRGASAMSDKGWDAFHRDTAMLIVGGAFHVWFGTCAVAASMSFDDDSPPRLLGDRSVLLASGDLEYVQLQEMGAFLGSMFGALMGAYTFYWLVGWDRDPVNLAHHLVFLGVSMVLARRSALTHSGLTAMAMEGSSPALNAMHVLRQSAPPRAPRHMPRLRVPHAGTCHTPPRGFMPPRVSCRLSRRPDGGGANVGLVWRLLPRLSRAARLPFREGRPAHHLPPSARARRLPKPRAARRD